MTTTAYDDQFTPPSKASVIEQARHRVAERYSHSYLKNAILNGDWDSGSLVQSAVDAIEAEQASCEGRKK